MRPEPPGQIPRPPAATPRPNSAPRYTHCYSKKATVALTRAERPLYRRPAHLACRIGRKCRARALHRDDYFALIAQNRAPNRDLNETKFRHSTSLPHSADVYIGDM